MRVKCKLRYPTQESLIVAARVLQEREAKSKYWPLGQFSHSPIVLLSNLKSHDLQVFVGISKYELSGQGSQANTEFTKVYLGHYLQVFVEVSMIVLFLHLLHSPVV